VGVVMSGSWVVNRWWDFKNSRQTDKVRTQRHTVL
jgi:hypothetical protein